MVLTLKEAGFLASFSPDGSRIVAIGGATTTRVWDAQTGAVVLTLEGGRGEPYFSADGLRIINSGAMTMTPEVWDAQTGVQVLTLKGHTGFVYSASFSPDGSRIVTASEDNTAKVWDAQTGVEVLTLKGHTNIVNSAFFSPDGSRIVTVSQDNTMKIWDATPINRQVVLANRFPAVLRGEDQPADNAERLAFAQMAYEGKNFAAAARIWARAMENDPKLGDGRQKPYRYNAARAAALAAAGQGQDGPQPDDDAKAKLRQQALGWLRAELAVWARLFESGPPQERPAILQTLGHWQQDTNLAGIRDAASLARLPAEEQKEVAQLWADVAKVEDGPFTQQMATLPAAAAKLLKQVRKQLKKRNPDYDGTLTPTFENDAVIGLTFTTDHVTDISPVRALSRLQKLEVQGSGAGRGSLTDLSPLKGMPLTFLGLQENGRLTELTPLKGMPLKNLALGGTGVTDLTPLSGMPLEWLFMWGNRVSDLTPLKGMPLKWLNCGGSGQKLDLTPLAGLRLEFLCVNHTKVSDLAALKDVPLKELLCSNTPVSDLNPLRGMRLRQLHIENCKVSNLGPVKGMPLNELDIKGTSVTDLSPLKDLPIKMLNCDFQAPRDAKTLGAIKTLETINGVPAKKFWETERTKRSPAPASNRG